MVPLPDGQSDVAAAPDALGGTACENDLGDGGGCHGLVGAHTQTTFLLSLLFALLPGLASVDHIIRAAMPRRCSPWLLPPLALLRHYRAERLLMPALAIKLVYWLFGRLLLSGYFPCAQDDMFLCIPDRWAVLVLY